MALDGCPWQWEQGPGAGKTEKVACGFFELNDERAIVDCAGAEERWVGPFFVDPLSVAHRVEHVRVIRGSRRREIPLPGVHVVVSGDGLAIRPLEALPQQKRIRTSLVRNVPVLGVYTSWVTLLVEGDQ